MIPFFRMAVASLSTYVFVTAAASLVTSSSSLPHRSFWPARRKHVSPWLDTTNRLFLPNRYGPSLIHVLSIRGGSEDEADEYEEYDGYDEECYEEEDQSSLSEGEGSDGEKQLLDVALDMGTKTVRVLGHASMELCKALYRAVDAGLNPPPPSEEEEEESSVVIKVMHTLQRMWSAIINPSPPPQEEDKGLEEPAGRSGGAATKKKKAKKSPQTPTDITPTHQEKQTSEPEKKALSETALDFGMYLKQAYQCNYDTSSTTTTPIRGGSLADALRTARSNTRLLIVFIPSSPPPKKTKDGSRPSFDTTCVKSLLSPTVLMDGVEYKKGSYLVWSVKSGSSEAVQAMKRLRATKPGKKGVPILLVAYPANVMDKYGRPKLVPKLLAQHHCNPPPTPESMAAWLRALRKRHAKQVNVMRHELKEAQLLQERVKGYHSSVKDDAERERLESRKRAEQEAAAAEEKRRLEEIQARRKELLESLPKEPVGSGPDVITVALRFPDGQSGRRKFSSDVHVSCVFNWVDGEFGMEREKVTLSTMNGSKSFTFDTIQGTKLKDAGLPRMCGLRVIPMKEEARAKEDDSDEEEEDDDEEEG